MAGWTVDCTVPDYPKCIICVAPHTSNWDFILGKLAYASIGRKAGFLMKEAWFFFPLRLIFKAMGGIPVPKKRGSSLVNVIVERFNQSTRLALAITPEGTRSRTTNWRHGFLFIAREADIPIVLGVIDFKTKRILLTDTFTPTGDVDADMRRIKDYYKPFTGKYPEKFTTE
ncbi:MAG: 1-acyl-sn-glycerol-3-phosphate acyltransferase [Bacteroides sp.]|nr:1-acyl-sn-glycerol-3-phosphate acyltransferase [Bacteroides sp.]MCM1412774.1 1-acyl-sn-glycerol-3-phosphate acyltransferase [Bacteroides sp.]MCM1470932.1 1-acyl-sn-glycerol-3-phosphate acyltransferase [Bacteroides sp.]